MMIFVYSRLFLITLGVIDCFVFALLFQAEEEYNEAKSVYTKLHAELYEELPALFDR